MCFLDGAAIKRRGEERRKHSPACKCILARLFHKSHDPFTADSREKFGNNNQENRSSDEIIRYFQKTHYS